MSDNNGIRERDLGQEKSSKLPQIFKDVNAEIFSALPLPVFITDADFILLWMNAAAEAFSPKSISDHINRPISELFFAEDLSFQDIKARLSEFGNTHPYIEFSFDSFFVKIKALVSSVSLNNRVYYLFQFRESNRDSENSNTNNSISESDFRLLNIVGNALPYPFYIIDVHNYKALIKNAAAKIMEERTLSTQCFTHEDSTDCNINARNCIIKYVLEAKAPVKVEHAYKLKDGETCFYEVYGFPVFGSNGSIDLIVYNAIDISERKANEVAIEEQQKILNDILSNLPGIAYRCSSNGEGWTLDYISPGCRQITGYSAKNLITLRSLHFGTLIHEADRERIWSEIEQAVQRNRKFRIEYRMVARNKKIKWVSEYGRGKMNTQNKLISLEGFITDITRVKMYDAKLKQELRINQSLSALGVDLLGEAINPDRLAMEVQNNAMEFTGSPFSVLIVPSPDDDGMIYYLKNKAGSEKQEFNGVLVAERNIPLVDYLESGKEELRNGQSILLSLEALGVEDESFTRLAGIPVNISNAPDGYLLLAGASGDYTWDILNIVKPFVNIYALWMHRIRAEKLLQFAKIKAEESDKMKSVFLSNMSHEIRTPMNAIVGFADMLHDVDLNRQEKEKFLDAITRSGDSLLMLINDIIDISKMEAGQLKLVTSRCDVNELLNELEIEFSRELERKKKSRLSLYIQKEFPDTEFIIHTDTLRLRQVLINLVGNAIKFTDEGFIEIGYRTQAGKLLFYVRDSGVGISKEDQAVIFERFGQAGAQQQKNVSGTGLGLTISKNIIELLGGNIWVESIPGEGSTFWFALPLIKVPAGSKQPKKKSSIPTINLTGKSILVVEDVDTNYFYISTLLEKLNAKVVRAVSGLKAVDICTENLEINLVLMDVELPVMNGYEATKKIKQSRPDLPIIAQTAYAMAGERERSAEAGCDDYLAKPIRKNDLIEAISRLI